MLRIVKGVKCALPQLVLKEERKNAPAYADQKMHENEAYLLNGSLWLAGVVEDKLFIVLTPPTVKQATCRRNGSLRKMDSAFFFVFDFSNPQTLYRVSITNYVTVVFEACLAVHSLQKNLEKRGKTCSKISCTS